MSNAHRRELRHFVRRLMLLLSAVLGIVVAGSLAFAADEHVSPAYGFVWTLDTITTLGTIPGPKDTGGRTIIAVLEIIGIGTLFYGLATVAEFFVSGQLSGILDERRTQKMIDSYSGHYIVCGCGRVGRQVARDLHEQQAEVVVIDPNPIHRQEAADIGVGYIEGQAADDHILIQAGIARAAAVIACVDSDAENVYITLSARELRADVTVIARASQEDAEHKLIRAGANQVISPYKTTGTEMARMALSSSRGQEAEA